MKNVYPSRIIKNRDIEFSDDPCLINPNNHQYKQRKDQIKIVEEKGLVKCIEITCGNCRRKLEIHPVYENHKI